jgi:virulence factor Mce-like protein
MTRRLTRRVAAVLATLVLAGAFSACSRGGGHYTVTAWFSSAISLYPDSQVRVLGLPAGHVKSIKVIDDKVRVVMSIPDDIPLPENVNATIIPLSFIGERYVQFFPAWKTGEAKLAANAVIPIEDTSVPVEPDETLAAVKHLLDAIDPQATGKLITNLAKDLDGTGDDLNAALKGLGTITETLGAKDAEVGAIIDHFDKLTATLSSRDATLGRVLDAFARTTDALADERTSIESLLASLASISTNGLALVGKHRVQLDKDLTVLSRTIRLVGDNIDQLDKILNSAPILTAGRNLDGKSGLAAAYNKNLHALDLRTVVTPAVSQLLGALGIPVTVCEPVTTTCPLPTGGALAAGLPDLNLVPSTVPSPTTRPAPKAAPPDTVSTVVKRAKADLRSSGRKHGGGLSGLIRTISGVFG